MHIPDGLLDLKTTSTTFVLSSTVLYFAIRKAKGTLEHKMVPVVASLAAFVFVIQMINFPISVGTSGHVIGAFLLTALIGPWLSTITLSLVLCVQAIVFQDGGILALPANIFNMAVCGSFVSYMVLHYFQYDLVNNFKLKNKVTVIIGSIFSVLTMALAGAVEFWSSGLFDFKMIATVLLSSHFFIGIGEGVISLIILTFLYKVKPDIINEYNR